jgi:alpha-tubulin suppressor-like RCC1 family protein
MKKFAFSLALAFALFGIAGCPGPNDLNPYEPPTDTPAVASASVAKIAAQQQSVAFTLTNSYSGTPVWRVYNAASGGTPAAGVTASSSGNTLTLSHASDIPAGIYYVSVTENGKTESGRLALTVEQPEGQSATPAIEDPADAIVLKNNETPNSVTFTLTVGADGNWKVYDEDGEDLANVTASYNADTRQLTLSSVDGPNLEPGYYYVSVTENGKAESGRLLLTVKPYEAPNQTATPDISQANAKVPMTSTSSASFTLAGGVNGAWKVYGTSEEGAVLADVTASYDAAEHTLTLSSNNGANLEPGTYYVSVTEEGKDESSRLKLTAEPYVPPEQSVTPIAAPVSVAKTAATQRSAVFPLANSNNYSGTLTWKVYNAASGETLAAGVTASSGGNMLTLSHVSDIPARTYYVSVTETGKAESGRLALTVRSYVQPGRTATPTIEPANASVSKAAGTQQSAVFTLRSSAAGTWKVYNAQSGGSPLATVSASYNEPDLTLTASGEDLAAGIYYVSVTESGKDESGRLALTVTAYVPEPTAMPVTASASFAKTAATQQSAVFTLSNSDSYSGTLTWKVYNAASGETLAAGVTASSSGPALTLSHASDIPARTYYVSVTESGKAESVRLALTVSPYVLPEQSVTPIAAPVSVAKTAATQRSAIFTLSNSNSYSGTLTWKVYNAASGETLAAGVTASSSGSALTLSHASDIPARTYYVSVTESGKDESGRLALTVTAYVPPDPGPGSDPVFYGQLDGGMGNSFVLKNNGQLYAVGANNLGQLGTGDTADLGSFTLVASGVKSFDTAMTWDVYQSEHTLILKNDGTVHGTGYNGSRALGLGEDNNDDISSFTEIPVPAGKTPAAVAAGEWHSLVLMTDGSVWAAGGNTYGQHGTGSREYTGTLVPTTIAGGATAVSAGEYHSLVLKDGNVWAAGNNEWGQLGNGKTVSEIPSDNDHESSFVQVFSGAKAIAAGLHFSMIVKNDGTVWAAGEGITPDGRFSYFSGEEIDQGSFHPIQSTFVQMRDSNGAAISGVKAIAVGLTHAIALKQDGSVWTIGGDDYGQLGNGTTLARGMSIDILTDSFTQAMPANSNIAAVGAGIFHSLIMKSDGTVYTSGLNDSKQLGLGNTENRESFTPVTNFIEKSAMPAVASRFADKAGEARSAVTFTLTNSPALSGTWKVYAAATGGALVTGVNASNSGSTLTLSHASDIPAGTYYITFTESGKDESARLSLAVAANGIPGFLVIRNTSGRTINNVLLYIDGDYVDQNCPPISSGSSYTFILSPGGYPVALYYNYSNAYFAPSYPVIAGRTTTLEFDSSFDLINKGTK